MFRIGRFNQVVPKSFLSFVLSFVEWNLGKLRVTLKAPKALLKGIHTTPMILVCHPLQKRSLVNLECRELVIPIW